MAKYLVSFRLKDNNSYDDRYAALIDAINEAGTGFWESATSMIAIDTNLSISGLGSRLKACVSEGVDFVLIREIDVKNTAYIGDPGEGFDYFFPDAKKL